ncbi:hypothetical protein E0H75_32350 [Kribbella capetownensis]|uniref:Uncharacterized protein n=1 Tax=Kribbella capetownensis TaxID=1572659 RepID=A0A4R0JE88_9ACTN|nr:hypothetical protein [Kribbella capetownensis]TCC45193.1 hypothetical protein E0H75_32350 [Kribbella capetownensis]
MTGTIWRGELIEIAAKGATQTGDAPGDGVGADILALVLATSGVLVMVACAWRLRRRRSASTPAMEATFVLSIGVLLVGLASAVVMFVLDDFLPPSMGENFVVFAAVFCAGAAWLTVAVRRDLKKSPDLPGIPI